MFELMRVIDRYVDQVIIKGRKFVKHVGRLFLNTAADRAHTEISGNDTIPTEEWSFSKTPESGILNIHTGSASKRKILVLHRETPGGAQTYTDIHFNFMLISLCLANLANEAAYFLINGVFASRANIISIVVGESIPVDMLIGLEHRGASGVDVKYRVHWNVVGA